MLTLTWLSQLDYIFFFYGLGFILLAVVCFSADRKRSSLPWIWLGLFGLIHGLNEWLDLMALSMWDSPMFKALRICVMALSFICLVEFGRLGMNSVSGKGPGRWATLALFAIGCTGWLYGWDGLNVFFRYFLGFVGGMWSALAIIQYRRISDDSGKRRNLLALGILLAAYAAASGIIVPKAPFVPASLLNHDSFLQMSHFPIQLLRGILALASAICVWQALSLHRMQRIYRTVFVCSMLMILAGGWHFTNRQGVSERSEWMNSLQSICTISAASINSELIKGIDSIEDLQNPRYKLLKKRLMKMRYASPDLRYIYLMVVRDGRIIFSADSVPPTAKDYSPPGDEYTDAPAELRALCRGERQSAIAEYEDKWGKWVSAFDSVREDATGKPVAILGMDYPQEVVLSAVCITRFYFIVIVLLLAILAVVLFYFRERREYFIESISEASKALLESEQSYRNQFDNNSAVMLLIDPKDGVIIDANAAAVSFYGYSWKQLLAMRITEINLLPEPQVLQAMASVSDEDGKRFESQHRIADGSLRNVEVSASSIQFGGRTVLHSIVQDITARKQAEAALRNSEEFQRSLMAQLPSGVVIINPQTHVIESVNAQAAAWFGADESLIVGQSCHGFLCPACEGVNKIVDNPEREMLRADGTRMPIIKSVKLVHVLGKERLHECFVDITDRKNAEDALRKSNVILSTQQETTLDGILVVDPENKLVSWNQRFIEMWGIPADVLETRSDELVMQSVLNKLADPEQFVAGVRRLYEDTNATSRDEIALVDGEIFDRHSAPMIGEDGTHYGRVWYFRDITERKQFEEKLFQSRAELERLNVELKASLLKANELTIQAEMAKARVEENAFELDYKSTHDTLTGLPNRLRFNNVLSGLVNDKRKSATQIGIMFLDLDKFKFVNDSLGHDIGDLLLVEVAKRCAGCVRDGDLLARMGGDEFTVILRHLVDLADIHVVGGRILNAMLRPFMINGNEINIGASIGVSVYPRDGVDVSGIVKRADTAMYKAKEAGRNNCQIYSPDMEADTLERLRVERELRTALKHGELEVYYQPRIEPLSGIPVGAEALIRWNHPDRGLLRPTEFLAYAEESGLMTQISDFVLGSVCSQLRGWSDSGYDPITVALNISESQLRRPDYIESMKRTIETYGVLTSSISLEVSGPTLLAASDAVRHAIQELRLQGVGVILDDFGTGPISLVALEGISVDCVKINSMLLARATGDSWQNVSIAASVAAAAHNMGLEVIAVGVETKEQMDVVTSLMCDAVQGYLISPPLALPEFENFIRQ